MKIDKPRSCRISPRQRGSAMVEFAVVGPIITLLGLGILQYGLLFFAKNQINHASFMAARAGSMGNAKMAALEDAYVKALIPLYGGGTDSAELTQALAKAQADMQGHLQIEVLNPTTESFDDFGDAALQEKYGSRAIRNSGLAYASVSDVRSNSGQNRHDANLLKLRITHGYEPKVPLMKLVYTKYLKWLDPKTDNFYTALVDAGRIPVVSNVTLQMQSDPVEGINVSTPGMGNAGHPSNPGDPPVTSELPPNCATLGCTVINSPGGGGADGSNGPGPIEPGSPGGDTPVCT